MIYNFGLVDYLHELRANKLLIIRPVESQIVAYYRLLSPIIAYYRLSSPIIAYYLLTLLNLANYRIEFYQEISSLPIPWPSLHDLMISMLNTMSTT